MTDRGSYDAWAAGRAEARVSDWLREVSEPEWSAVTGHEFFDALGCGVLPRETFANYLVQDYGFIDPFTALLGHAIGHAPAMGDRVVLGQFMGMLTSDENTFFQRAFDAFDVPRATREAPTYLDVTRDFRRILSEVGHSGSYAEMLAVLVVTEWVYLAWAERIHAAGDIDRFYKEWVGLHDNPDFVGFVGWLRQRLDEEALALPDPDFARMAERFRTAVRLERDFHDACWGG